MEVLMRTHLQHLRGAAFALALVVGGAAAATPIATAAEETTTMTVKVKGPGANKMTITPYSIAQEKAGAAPFRTWEGKPLSVKKKKVTFKIPTAYTDSMSLMVQAPWETGDAGYVPMAALSKDGGYCYPGTKKARAKINLKVVKQKVEGYGDTAVIPNAYWVKAGKPDTPPGHQDAPYCEVSR
jgi:hypothetical protein